MKFLRTGKVKIAALALPGDWRARLASEHVRDLARSVDELALIHRPTVRDGDNAIITGRDRIAAMHLLGHEVIDVDVFTATDHEVQLAIIVENLRRRVDNRDKLLADLADLYRRFETQPAEVVVQPEQQSKPGRKKAPTTVAREKAAAAAGVTTEAVRAAENREKARHAELTPEAAEVPAAPWADVAGALDAIDRLLVQAKTLLTKLTTAHPRQVERFPVHAARTALADATTLLRGMRPHSACPYCVKYLGGDYWCPACHGSLWITADQAAQVPKDLKDLPAPTAGEKSVVAKAVAVSMTESAPSPVRREPGVRKERKKKLDVRLKDEAGNETTVDPWGDPTEAA